MYRDVTNLSAIRLQSDVSSASGACAMWQLFGSHGTVLVQWQLRLTLYAGQMGLSFVPAGFAFYKHSRRV